MEKTCGLQQLRYVGSVDLTQWLAKHNEEDPLVFPEWPESDAHVPVMLEWPAGADEPCLLAVATSPEQLAGNRGPRRLWFCRIPRDELEKVTEAL